MTVELSQLKLTNLDLKMYGLYQAYFTIFLFVYLFLFCMLMHYSFIRDQRVYDLNYCIVASTRPSCFEAHVGLFKLLMKGIFNPYVLHCNPVQGQNRVFPV